MRYQFSLRVLICTVFALSIFIAIFVNRVERTEKAIAKVYSFGGAVSFHFETQNAGMVEPDAKPFGPKFLHDVFGEKYFRYVSSVELTGSGCNDIEFLNCFRRLDCACLAKLPISDLSSLKNMMKLEVLYLHDTNVRDISSLSTCSSLKFLNLQNTKVSDISPLFELEKLEEVILWNTCTSAAQIEQFKLVNPQCLVYHDF